jgi:hypothetical protein
MKPPVFSLLFPAPQIKTCHFVSRCRLHLAPVATSATAAVRRRRCHAQPPPRTSPPSEQGIFLFLVKCILGNVLSYYILDMYLGNLFMYYI